MTARGRSQGLAALLTVTPRPPHPVSSVSSGPRVWRVPLHMLQAGQATGPEGVSSRAAPHLTPSLSTAA